MELRIGDFEVELARSIVSDDGAVETVPRKLKPRKRRSKSNGNKKASRRS
jgi:hypothetical protein